jgi:hypothetical protein
MRKYYGLVEATGGVSHDTAYLIEAKSNGRKWFVTNADGKAKEYDTKAKALGQITKLENSAKRDGRVEAGGPVTTFRLYPIYY